jgi:hypothetical protein
MPRKLRRRAGTILAAVVVVLCWLAPACGSSTPSYCSAGDQLKSSAKELGNVDVTKNGLDSLKSAVKKVETDAKTFADEAKSTFAPQTEAVEKSLSELDTAVESAQGESAVSAVTTIKSPLTQVTTSINNLLSAVSDKC